MRYFSKAMLVASAALCLNLSAYSQDISLKINNVTVKEAIELLKKNTGYSFVFSSSDLNTRQRVSVSAENATIQEVVNQILKGQKGIDYEIQGKKIVVRKTAPVSSSTSQNKKSVSGKVVDANGEPVIGATIMEKGTTNGTITDFDGNFTLNVVDGAQLEVSYVGFQSQELKAVYGKNLAVTLKEDTEVLDEVVVVGYGTQKKVNLTGAVASVDFNDKTLSRPVTTVSSALSGMVAGLNIMQTSSKPNSESAAMTIRGTGTLNNSSPLVLVDGMEMSLNNVNPNDIASISVLKDAASCAIYGNRGANGVILITTKEGKEGKVNVTYSGKFSYNTPANLIERVTDYADYMEFMNESAENVGNTPFFSTSTIDEWREAKNNPNGISESGYPNYVAYPNTDWHDVIYNPKMMQEHSITLTGAEKRTKYSLSGSFLSNPGLVENSGVKKYYMRSNVFSDVTDFLTIGLRVWGWHADQERNNVDDMVGLSMNKAVPGIYPYYDGKYGVAETSEEDPATVNPLYLLNTEGGYYKNTKIFVNPSINIDIWKSIKFTSNFYYEYQSREDKLYNNDFRQLYCFSLGEERNSYPTTEELKAYPVFLYFNKDYGWKSTNTLNWSETFNKRHDVGVLLGYEESRSWGAVTDNKKLGMLDTSLTDFDAVTDADYITGNSFEFASRSVFGRFSYAYMSKYLFEANVRYDGSSRFASGNRWGVFPSFSAGWRVSEEKFMKNIKWIDNLKLRASWGKLGNNSIGNYEWQALYNSGLQYVFGGNKVSGIGLGAFSNHALEWESTAITNLGLDFGFLGNRLTGTIDVYNKVTDGILYSPTLSPTLSGFGSPKMNIAEVTNKGLELTVGWQDRIDEFSYCISGNFSFNKNEVSKYKGTLVREWRTDEKGNKYYYTNLGDVSTGDNVRVLEGHMINEFYMLDIYKGSGNYFNADGTVNPKGGPKDGMIRTEEDMKWLKSMMDEGYKFYPSQGVGKSKIYYGDYIYADINGDGIYGDEDDKEFQGYSKTPKYYFGIQGNMSWKGIDFSMNWAGAAGFKINWWTIGQNSNITSFGRAIGADVAYNHYFYNPENPEDPRTNLHSENPRLVFTNKGQSSVVNEFQLHNGNYLKLKNLTIGYTLPKNIVNKAFMQNVRIYVSGENLLTITKYKGVDPEMAVGDGYASMRQYAFGINVTF